MTEESHIHDLLGVRRRSSNMQDNQQDNHQQEQQQQQQPGLEINTDHSSPMSQLTSTAGDVTESLDDDVIAGRQCAAELSVEVGASLSSRVILTL